MCNQTPKINDEFVLQKCKHKWFNGLDAVIIEIRSPNLFVARSEQGEHIIGKQHIKNLVAVDV